MLAKKKRELSSANAYITFDIKIMLLIEHLRLRSAYGIAVRLKAIYHRLDDKVYPDIKIILASVG